LLIWFNLAAGVPDDLGIPGIWSSRRTVDVMTPFVAARCWAWA
jgi:hypothetical protein